MQSRDFFQHGLETYPLPELLEPHLGPPPSPPPPPPPPPVEPIDETQPVATTQNHGTRPRLNGTKRGIVEPGEDISHYRFFLPPVVGSYLQYPNKRVLYRPFPPNLDEIRDKLFKIEPILLDSQQIADYWPHVTNFWMLSTPPTAWHNGAVTEVFECRNRRRVTMKGKQNRSTGTGQRVRPTKDDLTGDVARCQQRIKVISYTKHAEELKDTCKPGFGNCQCLPEWLYMKRTDKTVEKNYVHTHDIDFLDRYKRSAGLMYYAKLKIEEGYSQSVVLKYIHEKYGPITRQAYHLSNADVANVSRPWRLQNKDVELKTEVEGETFEQKRRRDCLDAIEATSQAALAKALAEVCRQIPHTVDVVAPFLEYPEKADDAEMSKIVEGNDLVLPPPGMPAEKMILFEGYQGVAASPASTQPVSALNEPGEGVPQGPQAAITLPPSNELPLPNHDLPTHSPGPHVMPPPPAPPSHGPRAPLPAAASSTDPDTTSQAFISEASRTPPFAVPYQARCPILPPPVRTSTSAQLWPPTSITHPLSPRSGSAAPLSAVGSSPGPRPSWAVSTVPQKRPIDAVGGDRPRSSTEKRTLVEEISAQLRDEVHGGGSTSRGA